jgi:hypothetical protein
MVFRHGHLKSVHYLPSSRHHSRFWQWTPGRVFLQPGGGQDLGGQVVGGVGGLEQRPSLTHELEQVSYCVMVQVPEQHSAFVVQAPPSA